MEEEGSSSDHQDKINCEFKSAKYSEQRLKWPLRGKHILAQYNDDAILVYQAYSSEIADHAVKHQKFGGPRWNPKRMTWIKTNFLWMMFRSGWGRKNYQNRILGIWLKRSSFEQYLSMSARKGGNIRLQWDPDHYPDGSRHPYRSAIQIGVRLGSIESFANGDDIICIEDLTEFVASQHQAVNAKDWDSLLVAKETVYPLSNPEIIKNIGLDTYEPE